MFLPETHQSISQKSSDAKIQLGRVQGDLCRGTGAQGARKAYSPEKITALAVAAPRRKTAQGSLYRIAEYKKRH